MKFFVSFLVLRHLAGLHYFNCVIDIGVASTPKKLAHQRETTGSSSDSLQLRPFSKWELLLKDRICSLWEQIEYAPSGSKFFPLRAVPYDMANDFYHICYTPLPM